MTAQKTLDVPPQRIMVIGNVAAGKTHLSRRLNLIWKIPLTHVDRLQFLPGLSVRPYSEVSAQLKKIESQEHWIIDGYGPLELLESRLKQADLVIFLDWPLWRHRWWLIKRQMINIFSPRQELPEGCNELNWKHTKKMFQVLKSSHHQMRPELIRILGREEHRHKVVTIRTMRDWHRVFERGF